MLKSRVRYFFQSIISIFLLLSFLNPLIAQESQKKAEETQNRPEDIIQAQSLTEKYKSRLNEIDDDLTGLQKRIDDGDKSLDQEAAKVPDFLQIQEVALEEFKPYLNRWKLMRDSYEYVLQDVQSQLHEVAQIHVRLESKLQLWKIKESDAKLALSIEREGTQRAGLSQKLNDIRSITKMFEDESDHSDEVLTDLGKAKTALTQATETCETNYSLLEKRWENVRFSRLKWVNQPNLSTESFNLALQELQYRLRNINAYEESIVSYTNLVYSNLQDNLVRLFITLLVFFCIAFLLFKMAQAPLFLSSKNTLVEKFLQSFTKLIFRSFPFLFLVIVDGILLIGFPNLRVGIGFLFFFSMGSLWISGILLECSSILFINKKTRPKLLNIPNSSARFIHYHFSLLIFLTFCFSILNFSSYTLNYVSEAAQILEWFFEILIFVVILSLARPSWTSFLTDYSRHNKFFIVLKNFFHFLIFFVLALILVLDTMGYTLLSDYLADATLKSLGTILLMILFKNALREWAEHILPALLLRKFKFQLKIVMQWALTLQLWSRVTLWVLFIYTLSSIWDVLPELSSFLSQTWNWGFGLGPMKITVGLILSVFFTFYISTLISRVLELVLEKNIYPKKSWDPGIQQAFSTGTRYTITLVALLISLRLLGFDLQNITVLAGALGVGLGFGLQNIANNFASGIILLIERPIKVNDIIQVNNITGHVKKIGPRSTVIETLDKASILIPNGELLAGQLTNWTYGNSVAGFAIPIGVAYGSDVEKVKLLLTQIASSHEHVLKDPPPRVEFKEFGDSSLNFVLRVWIQDAGGRVDVQTDLMTQINKEFNENKIDIPFPQRVVRLEKVPGSESD